MHICQPQGYIQSQEQEAGTPLAFGSLINFTISLGIDGSAINDSLVFPTLVKSPIVALVTNPIY